VVQEWVEALWAGLHVQLLPTRLFFSLLCAAQLFAKVFEILFILWFIYLVNVDESRGGLESRGTSTGRAEKPVIFQERGSPTRASRGRPEEEEEESTDRSARYRISISDVKSNKDMDEEFAIEEVGRLEPLSSPRQVFRRRPKSGSELQRTRPFRKQKQSP